MAHARERFQCHMLRTSTKPWPDRSGTQTIALCSCPGCTRLACFGARNHSICPNCTVARACGTFPMLLPTCSRSGRQSPFPKLFIVVAQRVGQGLGQQQSRGLVQTAALGPELVEDGPVHLALKGAQVAFVFGPQAGGAQFADGLAQAFGGAEQAPGLL